MLYELLLTASCNAHLVMLLHLLKFSRYDTVLILGLQNETHQREQSTDSTMTVSHRHAVQTQSSATPEALGDVLPGLLNNKS